MGVCGMVFLFSRVKGQPVPCRFCGSPDGDGHLFWECTFPPLVEIRENPEFHDLMREDKAHCLDVPPTGHALWAEVGGGIIFVTPGEFAVKHKKLPVKIVVCFVVFMVLSCIC